MTKISEKKYKEVILYLAEKLGGEIKGKKIPKGVWIKIKLCYYKFFVILKLVK
jgi:hypothetical protein